MTSGVEGASLDVVEEVVVALIALAFLGLSSGFAGESGFVGDEYWWVGGSL